jgi:hypothetical protein
MKSHAIESAHARGRRPLLVLCAASAAWAALVAMTGGFAVEWGGVRLLASRSPRNATVIALITWAGWWLLVGARERAGWRRFVWGQVQRVLPLRAAASLPPRTAPVLAFAAAVVLVAVSIFNGAPYAGGSDAYGYVSQARLWARGGTLRVEQPLAREIDWPFAAEAVTPLGYRPIDNGAAIVPVYSPGLPMLMGLFERIASPRAVFYVVPLLAGLAVWSTYLMGARLVNRGVGLTAALLLATSPPFLFQAMLPMSDVPVTAWWALALALLLSGTRAAAFGAGLASGAALLTRPNLLPLAVVLGAALTWRAARSQGVRTLATHRLLLFAAGVVPGCLAVMVINRQLWGSVLASGYGPFAMLYSWRNLLPNLERYPLWLVDTETPLVLLALLAPVLIGRELGDADRASAARAVAITWLCFIGTVFLSYLFHLPNDGWFWLRYVLPAFPALLVLTAVVLFAAVDGLDRGRRVVALALIVLVVAGHGIAYGRTAGIFAVKEGERKWQTMGQYVAAELPERAVLIGKLHTGSIRYYANRFTVRYEWIPPDRLDYVVSDLQRLGYAPYIVLEDSEEPDFRARFEGQRTLLALDRLPAVLLDRSTKVRIYDPLDRGSGAPIGVGRPLPSGPGTVVIR